MLRCRQSSYRMEYLSSASSFTSSESSRSPFESSLDSISGFAGEQINVLASNPEKKVSLSGYWESDEAALICHKCRRKFTLFLRRHHCRICGCIFCSSCCFVRLSTRKNEADCSVQGLRACRKCYERKFPSRFSIRHLLSDSSSNLDSPRSESKIRHEMRPLLTYDSNRLTWRETMQNGNRTCTIDSLRCIARLATVDRIDHLLPQSSLEFIDNTPHRIQVSHQLAIETMRAFLQWQLQDIRNRASTGLQSLEGRDFALRFVDIVTSLARQTAYLLRECDIRNHLAFISTSTNSPVDSFLIRGVVLRKNVVHRRMRTCITSPAIALIDFPIALYAENDVLHSLRKIRTHENSMIRQITSRILLLEPDVVVSSKTVPRLAQDIFRHHDVAVVVQVEQNILNDLSRTTGATIISRDMIEQQITEDSLGRCGKFQVDTTLDADRPGDDLDSGPLMMFSDCPEEQIVTVVLQGVHMQTFEEICNTLQHLAVTAHLQNTFASLLNNVCSEFLDDDVIDSSRSTRHVTLKIRQGFGMTLSDNRRDLFLWLRLKHVTSDLSRTEMCSTAPFLEDLTLKQFLVRFCFNGLNITCSSACSPIGQLFDHIQVFIQNQRQVRFQAQHLSQKLVVGNHQRYRLSTRIAIWTKCIPCNGRTSPISVLSKAAEEISLKDFLQPWTTSNRSRSYNPLCRHELFKDHVWFMALDDAVVSITTSRCHPYELHCPWSIPSQDSNSHQQLVIEQTSSLVQTISSLLSFISDTIARLEVNCTTKEAMADSVLIRATWFRRKIARFETLHTASSHDISEIARLELLNKIFIWSSGSLLTENNTSSKVKAIPTQPVGFRTIPYRSRSSKRRRSIAANRSRSVDSIGGRQVTKAIRASHCQDFFLKSLVSIMNACMDCEPSADGVVVPVVPDDLSSYIAHLLSLKAHHDFCLADSSNIDYSVVEGSSHSTHSQGDAGDHFLHDLFVASIETKINCKAAYARHFRLLRQTLLKLSNKHYITSLTTSKPWHDHGGKSRARFFMTSDRRLILKSLTERQYKILIANAAAYLTYMQQTKGRSCLVPILGIYRLKYSKKSHSSISSLLFSRMRNEITNLIVMPNILYGMNISAEFDLKGARIMSSLLNATSQESQLFAYTNGIPIALKKNQYQTLMQLLQQDTQFLVEQQFPGSVDYSILVGVNGESRSLAVGIIDYISQYTLERKLENRIKTAQASLFGLKSPTVVSPIEYRERFMKAVRRYFLEIN